MTARGEAGAPIVCPDGGGPAASSCDDPARLAGLLPWPPARILDAGCGEGALSRRLAAVRSYLEVLAERRLPAAAPLRGTVVIHDSCVYARTEDVIQAPRELLAAARGRAGLRDDVPHLPHQPPQGRGRDDARP